mgnify:CR=1 FL=1
MALPLEKKDASQLLLKLLETGDYKMQAGLQREAFIRHHPVVQWVRLDRSETVVDELYNDTKNPRWLDPVDVHAHVDHSPSVQKLMRYGIQEERDVLITFSTVLLGDAGLLQNNSNFMIGDLIRWDNDLYEIVSQHRSKDGYWGSSNIPFHIVVSCKRYQFGV